jgi:hypothetical protein
MEPLASALSSIKSIRNSWFAVEASVSILAPVFYVVKRRPVAEALTSLYFDIID